MKNHSPARLASVLLICVAVGCASPSSEEGEPAAITASDAPPALLLRGGMVVDGTGADPVRADVRVRGDEIVAVGPELAPEGGERVIDATGLTVAPGFIDMHSHADRGVSGAPDAASQVRQGITTAIVGQDGGSEIPVSSFLEEIDRVHPSINYATLVGHGSVRSAVLGGDFRRPATAAEVEAMRQLVDRGMKDGALGLSSGTEYDPGFFAEPSELVALARAVRPYGGFYTSHVRDEENGVLDAWREVIAVGRESGVPVNVSHAKLASKPVWGMADSALGLIEQARKEGVRVSADWYPYTYWSSSMYVLLPDRDFESRPKWETALDEIGGAANVLVTRYRPDSSVNGKTLAEIAALWGKDPVTTAIEMMRAAGPNTGIIATAMNESDLERLVASPYTLICSDGGISGAHPRGYGSFPRVLGVYVREKKLLTLPAAVQKMTSASAALLGITDRGSIAVGKKADLVVFDPATIGDRGTKTDPALAPVGVSYVIVNGGVVLDDGRMSDARPGRALRRQNWTPYDVAATR